MASRFLVMSLATVIQLVVADLPANYTALSGLAKRGLLLDLVSQSSYLRQLPTAEPQSLTALFNPNSLVTLFTTQSDEWPNSDHEKLIHTYGAIAPVRLEIFDNSTFTGIFKAGSSAPALVRLSLGSQDAENFSPGLALKVLVDGKESQNIVANGGGQGKDRNFFARPFSNIIAKSTGPLAVAFNLSLYLIPGGEPARPIGIHNMPLQEQASVDSQGNSAERIIAPFQLNFSPSPALAYDANTQEDFRLKMAGIPDGSVLYTISGYSPRADFNVTDEVPASEYQVIGQLVTEGPFIASKYGDTRLFFRHHSLPWKFAANSAPGKHWSFLGSAQALSLSLGLSLCLSWISGAR